MMFWRGWGSSSGVDGRAGEALPLGVEASRGRHCFRLLKMKRAAGLSIGALPVGYVNAGYRNAFNGCLYLLRSKRVALLSVEVILVTLIIAPSLCALACAWLDRGQDMDRRDCFLCWGLEVE